MTPRGGREPTPRAGAVTTALEAIRELIRQRELLPGEPIRQQEMAERLGLSRVPVREALHALQTEGIVHHRPNQGYFVAKFSADQLEQIYLMRRVLEQALLARITWPTRDQLAELTAMNDLVRRAAEQGEVGLVVDMNRRFHEAIFALASLDTVQQEIRRLWDMSESYRALYLYGPSRLRIAAEHQVMIESLRTHDLAGLLTVADRHRSAAEEEIAAMLGGRVATSLEQPVA